jgi:hypothetical protein
MREGDDAYVILPSMSRFDKVLRGTVIKVTPTGQIVVGFRKHEEVRFTPNGVQIGDAHRWARGRLVTYEQARAHRDQQKAALKEAAQKKCWHDTCRILERKGPNADPDQLGVLLERLRAAMKGEIPARYFLGIAWEDEL